MGELKTIREEQALQSQHLSDHDDKIKKIESHLSSARCVRPHWMDISIYW
jgi:hypothetical protein